MKFPHFPYTIDQEYQKPVAYFSMEFAIDQTLKIYSGGLGFLAGSHMRSAYELKQNMVGIGILWKYGYYDQTRKQRNEMDVLFQEKAYNFLEDTGVEVEVEINRNPVKIKAFYLKPETFSSAPILLLSTEHPRNDYLAHTITHRLYDDNLTTRIAQYIVLGIGGAKVLEALGHQVEIYHFNEAHALPAAFYLYEKLKDLEAVKERVVFTTHTPEQAGNEVNQVGLLHRMGFFNHLPMEVVRKLDGYSQDTFNHTLAALRISKKANAVSRKHAEVSRAMWAEYDNVCGIDAITNAQNKKYWMDPILEQALANGDDEQLIQRKKALKRQLFDVVADQTGKLFDPDALTLVWARRFAGYKRADLITKNYERFHELLKNKDHPVQIIWAGKPYPMDYDSINIFNRLIELSKSYDRCAVLTGYELWLSKTLKTGSDIWLNNPRIPQEASGTSGMTAAMNGTVNLSTNDGWMIEFGRNEENAFVTREAATNLPPLQQDAIDRENLLNALQNEIIPIYYSDPGRWLQVMKRSMQDVNPAFDSNRMADEYYRKLYNYQEVLI